MKEKVFIVAPEKVPSKVADLLIRCIKASMVASGTRVRLTAQFREDLERLLREREPYCIFNGDGPDPIFLALKDFKTVSMWFPRGTYIIIYWAHGTIKWGKY